MIRSLLFLSSFFVIFQMNLNPWAGCEGYVKCERALELNSRQVLFESGHGKYWYLGDRVLPQVEHMYPLATIPDHPCHTIWLVDFLADEEIARALDGYIVIRTEGNYFEFIWIICKAAWLEEWYFPSLQRSKFYQFLFPISAW